MTTATQTNTQVSRPVGGWRGKSRELLRSIGIAFMTTIFVYYTVLFLNAGTIYFPNSANLIEIAAAFLFIFGNLWVNRRLSEWMPKLLKGVRPIPGIILEMLIVILSAVLCCFFLNYLPLRLVFPSESFQPTAVRIAFVVAVILGLFFYYFVERERQRKQLQKEMLRTAQLQKENYQAQLQHLKDQVQPHFLFNSLNVLGALIERHPQKAFVFNQKLSQMYRIFLERSDQELVSLKEEMELVEAFTYLLKTRFGDCLEIELDIPPGALQKFLPPGGVQTLIENAVKHNGSTKKDPLKVRVYVEQDYLQVENHLRPRPVEGPSSGRGLKNLRNRYRYLSDKGPEFRKTDTHFLASLPLMSLEQDK